MTRPSADAVMADVAGRARPAPPRLSDAWRTSPRTWRVGALVAGACGPAMALTGHVPAASGLAVGALVPAALIDACHHRLPNRWVGAAGLCFTVVALLQGVLGAPIDTAGAAIGAAVLAGPMLGLHLLSPAAMGFGDVKAGFVLGACLGVLDWRLALTGLALASGITSCVAIARRRPTVAFGPGLVLGALIALAAHTTFVDATTTASHVTPAHLGPAPLGPDQEAQR
jgi:leader peptidase (prepilin peptidase)/N-methyltransferase